MFLYESTTVTDKEKNKVFMAYNGHLSAFNSMSNSGVVEVVTEGKDLFQIRVHKPSLTKLDEKRYYFTITLTDDSGY